MGVSVPPLATWKSKADFVSVDLRDVLCIGGMIWWVASWSPAVRCAFPPDWAAGASSAMMNYLFVCVLGISMKAVRNKDRQEDSDQISIDRGEETCKERSKKPKRRTAKGLWGRTRF
jgi:hypothetical protein